MRKFIASEKNMTEKELKKLSRKQILELLLKQTERADRLEAKLEEAKRKIESKELIQHESGSIAEAALKLNGVFEAAQKSADQYLKNIEFSAKKHSEELEALEAERKAFEAEKQKFEEEKIAFYAFRERSGNKIPLIDETAGDKKSSSNKKQSSKSEKNPKAKQKKKKAKKR